MVYCDVLSGCVVGDLSFGFLSKVFILYDRHFIDPAFIGLFANGSGNQAFAQRARCGSPQSIFWTLCCIHVEPSNVELCDRCERCG